MSEVLQMAIVAVLTLLVAAASMAVVLTLRRERMVAEELRRSAANYEMRLSPEREYLDRQVRDLYESYARTEERVRELNEIVGSSLTATPELPEPQSAFDRSLALAQKSKFLQGLGINTQSIEVKESSVFVLTPFARENEVTFQVCRSVCASLGLAAFRASETYESESILNAIIRSIVSSRFIIANLSGRNPNVFYEMAIAQMLEKRVVMIAHATEKIDFDVSHQSIVLFDSHDELQLRLTQAIARYGLQEASQSDVYMARRRGSNWEVVRPGEVNAVKSYATQKEALRAARTLAQQSKGEYLVQDRDGRVVSFESFQEE